MDLNNSVTSIAVVQIKIFYKICATIKPSVLDVSLIYYVVVFFINTVVGCV